MIKFDTYRLVNESLGMYSLGVAPVQSLGISSNFPGIGEAGKPPFGKNAEDDEEGGEEGGFGGEEGGEEGGFGGEEGGEGDFGGEGEEDADLGAEIGDEADELGGEEGEMGGIEDRIASLEDKLDQILAKLGGEEGGGDELGAEIGGDELGGEEDADLDHEDDLGDFGGGEDEEDDEAGPPMMGKKPAATPFMMMMAKKMKAEGKGDAEKGGEKPTFMMKKAKKCGTGNEKVILDKAKKCSSGMGKKKMGDDLLPMKKGCSKGCGKGCKKCKAMKKESTGYERPAQYDPSEAAFLKSIREQLASTDVRKKWSDGMRDLKKEDLLLPPPNSLEAMPEPKTVQAGDVGYAPQGRVGSGDEFTTEAIQDIMARLARLERH